MTPGIQRLHAAIRRFEMIGAWGLAENLRKILRGMK